MQKGLHHVCVLAPLLFNLLFATVINVAYTRSKADKDIMDTMGGRGKSTIGKSVLARSLWGVRYADNTGVVS